MSPLIGVTCGLEDNSISLYRNYAQAVLMAGGTPLLLSLDTPPEAVRDCVARLDGLMVTGGRDLDPRLFGEEPAPQTDEPCAERDRLELEAVRACRALGKPVLGICRGVQAMAIALGGTLVQDIPTRYPDGLAHRQQGGWGCYCHSVTVAPGSRLREIVGADSLEVNSYHHQSVERAPDGLRATAFAPDGVIEALEAPGEPLFLGVQWHPERLYLNDPLSLALFAALTRAAGARQA